MNIQEKLYHRIHSLSNDVGSSKKKGVMYHVPSSTGLMNPKGIVGGGAAKCASAVRPVQKL